MKSNFEWYIFKDENLDNPMAGFVNKEDAIAFSRLREDSVMILHKSVIDKLYRESSKDKPKDYWCIVEYNAHGRCVLYWNASNSRFGSTPCFIHESDFNALLETGDKNRMPYLYSTKEEASKFAKLFFIESCRIERV